MTDDTKITVAEYLLTRLKSLGVNHLFGIPGDFILPLFEKMVDHEVEHIAACNELNAGYAADGYARLRGLGAAAVTYGPGSFSIVNAVAGAYAEEVPLVIISGGPATSAYQRRPVLHHLLLDRYETSINIFRNITEFAALLDDAGSACAQIDRALCISLCFSRYPPMSSWPWWMRLPLPCITRPVSTGTGKRRKKRP